MSDGGWMDGTIRSHSTPVLTRQLRQIELDRFVFYNEIYKKNIRGISKDGLGEVQLRSNR